MIVEFRIYQIKPGLRERFVHFFEHKSGPAQRSKGINLLGPFIDLENENVVVCVRGFQNLHERDRMRDLFYGGPEWKDDLKKEAMRMVDSYKVVLAQTTSRTFKLED